jgi:hypothetical protein
MSSRLAGTAIAGSGILHVSFLCFCAESCLSGHDNIADAQACAYEQ